MRPPSRWTSLALWTLQARLAGGFRLAPPVAQLEQEPNVLPLGFLRFIGAREALGALAIAIR